MTTAPGTKIAKLLRLACCGTAPDGERLAAVERLSALAVAYELDWDTALAGNPELTREQLQKVYAAGIEAGARREREARAAADWSTAGRSRTGEIGTHARALAKILAAAEDAAAEGYLDAWFVQFAADMRTRLKRWGPSTFVSERQWEYLERLRQHLELAGFLS